MISGELTTDLHLLKNLKIFWKSGSSITKNRTDEIHLLRIL